MGFIFITAGILLIAYISFLRLKHDNWYFWAAGVVLLVNAGLYLLGQAFTHKIKSDLIRKQRSKKMEGAEHVAG